MSNLLVITEDERHNGVDVCTDLLSFIRLC